MGKMKGQGKYKDLKNKKRKNLDRDIQKLSEEMERNVSGGKYRYEYTKVTTTSNALGDGSQVYTGVKIDL